MDATTATAAGKAITNRRELINGLSRFARSSTPIGLTLFLLDFLQYAAAIAGVLLLPALWMKVIAGVFAGFKLSNLVVLAHDAAHNTLTANRRLNWLLAVLSLMPGFFNYRLWCWDHHLLHHPWPNGEHPDAFKPLSKAQYDALPPHRRLLQRLYRNSAWVSTDTHFGTRYCVERYSGAAVFDHSVHHAHPRVPCYHVAEAQAWLHAHSAGSLVSEPLSLVRLHQLLRMCKLYDYEGRRWLDFDGIPTTDSASLHRAAEPASMLEPAPSVT